MMLLITIGLAMLAPAGAGGSVPAPALPRPVPIGVGPSFRPPAARGAALAGQPILGLACAAGRKATMAVHVEVFARNRVVPVPWGIGRHGDCRYPAWTDEP